MEIRCDDRSSMKYVTGVPARRQEMIAGTALQAGWTMTCAYPEDQVRMFGYRHEEALHLTCGIAAAMERSNKDALHVVAGPYKSAATLERRIEGCRYPFPVRVPDGFLTDLSSIPRFGPWHIGRIGPHLKASAVQDWLYAASRVQGATSAGAQRGIRRRQRRAALALGHVRRGSLVRNVRLLSAKDARCHPCQAAAGGDGTRREQPQIALAAAPSGALPYLLITVYALAICNGRSFAGPYAGRAAASSERGFPKSKALRSQHLEQDD